MPRLNLLPVLAIMLLGAATASAQEWKEHRSDDCRCSALFPGTPQAQTQRMPSNFGPLESKMIMLDIKNVAFYGVAYVDYPKDATSKPQETLNAARDGAVSKVKGTLKSENKITMNGYPGRELRIDAPGEAVLLARIYLVKERLYQTIVVTKVAQVDSPENKKFLESFKFDKP